MGAYIINIPDTVDRIIYVNVGPDSGRTYISSHRVEDLTPYTEPDLEQVKTDWYKAGREAEKVRQPDIEQVRKEAYEDGYKTAKVQCNIQAEKDLREVGERHYQKGLSDAWEAARKICLEDGDGGIPASVVNDIFNVRYYRYALRDFSATEAIEKIRQYEQEKEDEIQVGDEVEMKCGVSPAIYMQGTKGSDEIYLLFNDGSCGVHSKSEIERKTGRTFPEIAEVLQKMKEQDNG